MPPRARRRHSRHARRRQQRPGRVGRGPQLDDGVPVVEAVRDRLEQALANLVRNAIDATVAVADAPRRIEIRSAVLPDDYVEVSVVDNGCGLPEQARERIFEPFFTTKTTGTGLGLSIVRRIAELHGGRATAESAGPGLGAVFSVRFPEEAVGLY